ncbi:MAG: GGDEF domain-containing protein [Deltaproteobacteria bacterium]|nr:GGDEF domain-containing protein [Deltaproteobacteria bacterium]
MGEEAEDRYRRKYLELLEEVDGKEKQWAEIDGRLRRILAHLLIVAEGPGSVEISAELSAIRDRMREGLDFAAIEAHVEALKERVLRESRWADTQALLPPVHQILIHLVERLPLPPEMAERRAALVENLETGIAADAMPDAIEAVSGLVFEVRRRAQEERRELERLLQDITGRLQELDAGFQAAHEAAESGFASNRSLDAAVRAEVQGLEASARTVGDLTGLRRAVTDTLESIRTHLEAKQHEDRGREEALRREVGSLRESIARLEREVDEHREKTRVAREMSLRDPLTGCANRLAYAERAASEEARWKRYGAALSLVVFDLDHFKTINDTFGHRAGDQVLKAVAQIAGSHLRQADFFARYGGEEFVALLPETRLDAAVAAAEKVRRAVEAFRFHSRGKRVVVTLSCGAAELGGDDALASAFERADRALYRAKGAGRNRTEKG